jgi:hypothetical protein
MRLGSAPSHVASPIWRTVTFSRAAIILPLDFVAFY